MLCWKFYAQFINNVKKERSNKILNLLIEKKLKESDLNSLKESLEYQHQPADSYFSLKKGELPESTKLDIKNFVDSGVLQSYKNW